MHFAATNYILMGLRCYIDPWVYCTNNLSQTDLWLHVKQGKLQEDVKTVDPKELSSQRSILFHTSRQTVTPTATRAEDGTMWLPLFYLL